METRVQKTAEDYKRLEKDLQKIISDKSSLEKKMQLTANKLTKAQQELKDEQSLNALLRNDQQSWTEKTKNLEENLQKLKETKEKVGRNLNL